MKTKVLTVTHAKAKSKRRPVIKLQGDWLGKIGFEAGKVVTAQYQKGKITLRLGDSITGGLRTSRGLFQVRREKAYPQIDLKGFWLERFGFTAGNIIIARYEYGLIIILPIDLDQYTLEV
ncbi:MAG: type I toxin-antitoxin system SymE family toxin [Firmicutes bacterium]|nr:type I toxin-antitoxin system SymE family toxin [Bacillota bacterium]